MRGQEVSGWPGLGLGVLAEDRLGAAGVQLVVLGLGLGFVAVWALDRLYTRSSNYWPLIPGGILVLVAIAPAVPPLGVIVEQLWPVALIAVGIALVVAALTRRTGH